MKMTKETVQLFREKGSWHAIFSSREVREVMGTSIIPTAFTDKMPPEQVIKEISKLNPEADVSVIL